MLLDDNMALYQPFFFQWHELLLTLSASIWGQDSYNTLNVLSSAQNTFFFLRLSLFVTYLCMFSLTHLA